VILGDFLEAEKMGGEKRAKIWGGDWDEVVNQVLLMEIDRIKNISMK
jgi:hypothetical protein